MWPARETVYGEHIATWDSLELDGNPRHGHTSHTKKVKECDVASNCPVECIIIIISSSLVHQH